MNHHDPARLDSELEGLATGITDSIGMIKGTGHAGGYVTVLYPNTKRPWIRSVGAVVVRNEHRASGYAMLGDDDHAHFVVMFQPNFESQ